MSVTTEITRLQQAKAAIKTSIEGKGVTVSSGATLDQYSALIDNIQTGGSQGFITNKLGGAILPVTWPGGNTDAVGTYQYTSSKTISNAYIGAGIDSYYFTPTQSLPYEATHYDAAMGPNLSITNGLLLTLTWRDSYDGIDTVDNTNASYFCPFFIYFKASDNTVDVDWFFAPNVEYIPCFAKDTLITLSDGTKKLVQNLEYDDDLLVWDFDKGEQTSAKPLWISKTLNTRKYARVVLSDETSVNFIGKDHYHRMFCVETGSFVGSIDMVGKHTLKEDGKIVEVLSFDIIEEPVEYYNVISNYHINLYANGILTSCRYSNIYPVQDMKYAKDEREIVPYESYNNLISREWYDGMRLGEQTLPIADTIQYISLRNILDKKREQK